MRRTRILSSASALALTLVAVPGVAQCAPAPGGAPSSSAAPTASATASTPGDAPSSSAPRTASATAPAAATCAEQTLADLSVPQQVGQLFVAGVDADDPTAAQLRQVTDYHLGGVILTGGSSAGVRATARVTGDVRDHATGSGGVEPWISADQEGGYVQHLKGSGFSDMPTALTQGGWSTAKLTDRAELWGGELRQAGVNLNLAPVLDTVPSDLGRDNKPIGYWYREFGHTPATVASRGTAFAAGMRAAGVQTAGKHFPGLGRVLGNTDTAEDVVDDVTTRDDPYLQPFQTAVDRGVPVVMASTARYDEIDPDHLAAFSPTVLQDMLRGDLGFTGVIMSDDLGVAAAVQDIPAGTRAVRFVQRGGTVVLTVDPGTLPGMYQAVLDRANAQPAFLTKVHDEALHVLRAKQEAGLLTCG
jgi:beta-N-acetylhexosaminidase